MFSVVIPLYNKAPYIAKAITSVLNQTYVNFELIIINDGSTDNSIEEVYKFNDQRINFISQKNAGVSVARNIGVKHARFQYIAFLDADDWWGCHFLEEMATLINQYNEANLFGTSYYYVKNGKNQLPNIGLPSGFEAGYINYFAVYAKTFWVPINCSFVVISKSIFEKESGFNSNIKFSEDFDLWARVAIQSKVAYVNKFLAYSNQDVDIHNRALNGKIRSKETHIIFNIEHLERAAKNNRSLKKLLDGLKVRSLYNYYLKGLYTDEINKLLETVNWSQQPFIYKFIYKAPKIIVYLFTGIKQLGSAIKTNLYNTFVSVK
ncbi:glycosyltransferase family 2 protein [Spirosoma daeguense]